MGRSFRSVRMGANEISGRWERAADRMKGDDVICGKNLAEMAKNYSSEAFYAFNDPLEAVFFSALVRICRDKNLTGCTENRGGLPYERDQESTDNGGEGTDGPDGGSCSAEAR
jgi:hypothetical protein